MGGNPQKMKKTTLKNQEMIHPNLNYPLRQGKNVQFPFSSLPFENIHDFLKTIVAFKTKERLNVRCEMPF